MSEMRHLRDQIGKRVVVDLGDVTVTMPRRKGVLTELRPSGPRVRLDGDDKDQTVASWRIALDRPPQEGRRDGE